MARFVLFEDHLVFKSVSARDDVMFCFCGASFITKTLAVCLLVAVLQNHNASCVFRDATDAYRGATDHPRCRNGQLPLLEERSSFTGGVGVEAAPRKLRAPSQIYTIAPK